MWLTLYRVLTVFGEGRKNELATSRSSTSDTTRLGGHDWLVLLSGAYKSLQRVSSFAVCTRLAVSTVELGENVRLVMLSEFLEMYIRFSVLLCTWVWQMTQGASKSMISYSRSTKSALLVVSFV